jgi:hypothetical protein
VAQLADKIAEVTPPPCVGRVSSSGDDISTSTALIDELAWQVAALSTNVSSISTITGMTALKTFFTLCRTVTSP